METEHEWNFIDHQSHADSKFEILIGAGAGGGRRARSSAVNA